ncbi:MAG: ABC transporter ATP-binding protein, partial [Syntrophobacteraceae bacterium]
NLTRRLQKSAQVSVQVSGMAAELVPVLQELKGVEQVSVDEDDHGRLLVETDRAQDLRPEIARVVVREGMGLLELRLVDLSLEDIFIELVTNEPVQEEVQE